MLAVRKRCKCTWFSAARRAWQRVLIENNVGVAFATTSLKKRIKFAPFISEKSYWNPFLILKCMESVFPCKSPYLFDKPMLAVSKRCKCTWFSAARHAWQRVLIKNNVGVAFATTSLKKKIKFAPFISEKSYWNPFLILECMESVIPCQITLSFWHTYACGP